MSGSLSVVLPVRNVERTLADSLQRVLEVLSDLTGHFEVVIVDQGSTDQTADVAHELAIQFPQLRVSRPHADAAESGEFKDDLQQTTGDYVFVHQGHIPFNVNDFRRLWEICRTEPSESLRAGTAARELRDVADAHAPDRGLCGLGRELGGIRAMCRRTD